jgi:hypothetical protein
MKITSKRTGRGVKITFRSRRRILFDQVAAELLAEHAHYTALACEPGQTEADWYRGQGALQALEDALDAVKELIQP